MASRVSRLLHTAARWTASRTSPGRPFLGYLIAALAGVLPNFEAPKNIILGLLALGGMYAVLRARARIWPRDAIDWSLLCVALASLISLAGNWHAHHAMRGLKDIVSWAGVFWIVRYAGISRRDQRLLAAIAVASTLAGSLIGWADFVAERKAVFELHSAGAVTQSVTYVGIAIMLGLGLLLDQTGISVAKAARARLLWGATLVPLVVVVFMMGSRGGVLAIGCAVVLAAAMQRRRRIILLSFALAVAIGAITQYLLPDSMGQYRLWNKAVSVMHDGMRSTADQERLSIWKIAIAQAQRPETWLVGIGPGNFRYISPQDIDQAEAERGVSRLSHAHNLFLNKFIEEGVLGLGSFLMFLVLVARSVVAYARRQDDGCTWQWYGAVGALVVPIVSGFFNAPWHQEHAIFASMTLAMFLACACRRDHVES